MGLNSKQQTAPTTTPPIGINDCTTTYGTVYFWPISNARIAWDIMSIIDPIFTLILFIGVLVAALRISPKPARYALLVAAAYLSFGIVQHYRAMQMQHELAQSRHQTIIRGRVMPNLGLLISWRSIYRSGNTLYLDTIITPLLEPSYTVKGAHVAWFSKQRLPLTIKQNPSLIKDFDIFNQFSDGYLAAFKNKPLLLADMRYTLRYHPLATLWGIQFPKDKSKPHVLWLRNTTTTA